MANTRQELSLIHSRGLATPNKKYYRDDGEVFIGTPDRRLKVLDKSSLVRFKPIEGIQTTNVQTAIELVDTKLNTRIKQVEISFGTASYTNYKIFDIVDIDVKENDIIIPSIAYVAPTSKSLDELEMDDIICIAGQSTNGNFKLIVKSLTGSLAGFFKVNYIIQWL